MTDLRTAAQQALEALDSEHPDIQLRAAVALRAALAQEEQEPAIYPDEAREMGLEEVALYTAPPRSEWQGLTQKEIIDGREQLPTRRLSRRQGGRRLRLAVSAKRSQASRNHSGRAPTLPRPG